VSSMSPVVCRRARVLFTLLSLNVLLVTSVNHVVQKVWQTASKIFQYKMKTGHVGPHILRELIFWLFTPVDPQGFVFSFSEKKKKRKKKKLTTLSRKFGKQLQKIFNDKPDYFIGICMFSPIMYFKCYVKYSLIIALYIIVAY
jgi:hypothetical protein